MSKPSKRKPCKRDGCKFDKRSGGHLCRYHWLLEQPAEVQIEAAQQRLGEAPVPHIPRVGKKDWPPHTRWCAPCQTFVPLFYTNGSKCRACNSLKSHSARIEKVYGVTADDYSALMVLQGGVCYICQHKPRRKRLAVDHDHNSGEVRGLLCADSDRGCNHAILGNIRDIEAARRIVDYLEDPPYARLQRSREDDWDF